jgi:hypothetical protein
MASDDIFHIIGFTTQNILDDSQMKLTGLGHVVLKRNEELWRQIGPLVAAEQAGKVTRHIFEVYSITPFVFGSGDDLPAAIKRLGNESYMDVEFLNDAALKLCSEYGIQLPRVIGKITRAELPPPPHLGITTKGVCYKRA